VSGASELKIDIAERFQHLPHAPIVEAVIDVRARAEGSWEEEAVKSQVSAKLPNYSYLDSQRTYETEIKLAPEKPEQVFRDLGCKGVRFRSKDERQICQFNRDGFVFSRLPPYEDWEKLYGEAMRLWQVYSDIARPTQLQRLGLRFINRIELPSGELRYEDYIQPAAEPPRLLQVPFHGFLHLDTLAVPGHPYVINVIRTIQPAPDQPLAVILDIDVFTAVALDLDPRAMAQRLLEMRWLKNKVFFGSITDKALAKFK